MLSTLDIKLLGGFCLSCADKPVVGVTTERPQALLAYRKMGFKALPF